MIQSTKIASARRLDPSADAGDEPNRPSQDRTGRGPLAPGGAPLVVALRAEQLLQGVVGARQVGDVGGMEQPGSVTARHLAEALKGCAEIASAVAMVPHRRQQAIEAPPDLGPRLTGGVGQQPRGGVHQDEALPHRGPQRGGAGKRPLTSSFSRMRGRDPPLWLGPAPS